MLPISNILAPVDFSERSLGMMAYVKALATKYNAAVTLLHVVNPFYGLPATGLSGPALLPVSKDFIAGREEQLAKFAADILAGVRVERYVFEGDTAAQIVEYAKDSKIDLIAMPTHGYGAFRRFLIDSFTSHVLHDAPCPVLTGVHMEEKKAPTPDFSHVLCAVDLGTQSADVLRYASCLSKDLKAKLSVVHAVAQIDRGIALEVPPEFQTEMTKKVQSEMEKLQASAGVSDAELFLEPGDAAHTVCDVAKSERCGLLVIGRGVSEPGGRLKSAAYSIIRQSPCPVISI